MGSWDEYIRCSDFYSSYEGATSSGGKRRGHAGITIVEQTVQKSLRRSINQPRPSRTGPINIVYE